jgi:hypothetical protein
MGLRPPKNPPPRWAALSILAGSVAMTLGGFLPWARTGTHTVWGSSSGGAGVATAGLAAFVLSVLIVGGRRWPAPIILLLGTFCTATTAYYVLDPGTVASDAGLPGHGSAAWGLYLAFLGSATATGAAAVIARLRSRSRRT